MGCRRVVGIELASQAADEDLDDVAVALEVLVVEALGQLGLGDHFAGAQHQVLENAVFEGRELHGRAVDCHGLRARVERDRAADELGLAQPPARRISACTRASTSSKWNGLAT